MGVERGCPGDRGHQGRLEVMRSTLLVLLCASCWTSPTARQQSVPPAREERPNDTGPHTPAATPCPVAYGSTDICTPADPMSVVVKQRMDYGQGPGPVEAVASLEWPRCTYPEGTCQCQQGPPRCQGGAAVRPPPPGWTPPPFRWECTPVTRADGCPGVAPRPGEPCMVAHGCGYCIARYSCDQGKWSLPIVGPPAP